MPSSQTRSAFTLLEVIVAVTILVVLSTAAFVGYSSYVSASRDSKRVSDLSAIYGGLQTFAAKNSSLPSPTDKVDLTYLGVKIGEQGYAGKEVLQEINTVQGGKDPANRPYLYNVEISKQKGQLVTFFENKDQGGRLSLDLGIPSVYADNTYESLFPAATGTRLGVFIMSGSLEPIQETWTGSVALETLALSGGVAVGSCIGESGEPVSVTDNNISQVSNCYITSKPLGRWAIPSNPRNIFASGSTWTKNWNTNACPVASMSVVTLNPGVDTIPAVLAANTIYILNPGDYPVTRASNTSGSPCSAIIGKDHENPVSQLISYTGATNIASLFEGNGNNLIISNLTLSGSQVGGTTGNGMQLSVSNSTFGNIHVVGNSSNGIFCVSCGRSSFEDIVTHGNTNHGFNAGEGCYPNFAESIVSQLRSFNNGGAGMYLGRVCAASGNAFGNIQLNKLTLYNNGTGFMFSGNGNVYSSAHISNIRSFNNISDGVFFQQISGVMLSNIVTFNNGGHGVNGYIHNGTHGGFYVSNIVSFSNGGDGSNIGVFWTFQSSMVQSNAHAYNNTGMGIYYNYSQPARSYNTMKTFSNGGASSLGWGTFGDAGDFTGTGFLTGTHDTTGTYDSTWAIAPDVAGWDTNLRGRQSGVTLPENVNFTFGSNVPNQLPTYLADGCTALAAPRCSPAIGPSWTYDVSKKVGEW